MELKPTQSSSNLSDNSKKHNTPLREQSQETNVIGGVKKAVVLVSEDVGKKLNIVG